jgi:hypothetical protein
MPKGGKPEDLTGRTYGRWKVRRRDARPEKGAVNWWCVCLDCGAEKKVRAAYLVGNKSTRCLSCHARRNTLPIHPRKCSACKDPFTGTARQTYCPACQNSKGA